MNMLAQIRIEEEVKLSFIEESNTIFTLAYGKVKVILFNPTNCVTANITCTNVIHLTTDGTIVNITPVMLQGKRYY